MPWWGWLLLMLGVFLYGGLLGMAFHRHLQRGHDDVMVARHGDDLFAILMETRAGRLRYEMVVTDWGEDYLPIEMRWRWTIWDADRVLRARIVDIKGIEQPDMSGVVSPYMLGNAPTRERAEADALAWFAAQRNVGLVVGAE